MKVVQVIGVPMDLGQNRRGVDMGPSAVRYAGLKQRLERLQLTVHDEGDVHVPNPDEEQVATTTGRYQTVAAVCQEAYEIACRCWEEHEFALFLGGDHSISIGTVAAAARGGSVGVIWVDAHGDFNTPATSPSGNIHGMPVAALIGDGAPELVNVGFAGAKIQPAHIVQVGIRDLDEQERIRLRESGITVYTMRDIDEEGMARIAKQTLGRLGHLDRLHVSLDMDSLDPESAPGVGTPVPGGLSYREAHLLMEILGDSGKVGSMDIVEVNPILDDGNRTARLAVELAASLLGQRIF